MLTSDFISHDSFVGYQNKVMSVNSNKTETSRYSYKWARRNSQFLATDSTQLIFRLLYGPVFNRGKGESLPWSTGSSGMHVVSRNVERAGITRLSDMGLRSS